MATRNYKMADADMFQYSRTYRQHFINHQASFSALDPDFNAPYAENWLAAVEASESQETAETRDDQLQQETADVEEMMKLARAKHGEMKYFILKAFKTKPNIADKFGLDNYEEAGASQAKMAAYMQNLYNLSNSGAYKPALLAAGCTQLRIDDILTIKSNLSTQDTEQNVFKTNEPVATVERINRHNETWEFSQRVNEASKVIFAEQAELLNLFLFPRHSEDSSAFNLVGTARNTADNTALAGVAVEILGLGLTTTTDSSGEYGFGAVPAGTYSVKFSKAGFQDLTLQADVPASGQVALDAALAVV